jgi:hypothetical protein
MTLKIHSSSKIQGKTIILTEPPVSYNQIYAVFFPENRYAGGVGGQNWRILDLSGTINNKPSYGYGDETISWNSTLSRWEMNNAYQGTISYSPQNTQYPYQVTHWYYGENILDSQVSVTPYNN